MKTLQEQIIAKQQEALNKIANPVGWMQNDAEKRGLRLDGMWAIKIAENPNWLREIAETALKEIAAIEAKRDELSQVEAKEVKSAERETLIDFCKWMKWTGEYEIVVDLFLNQFKPK